MDGLLTSLLLSLLAGGAIPLGAHLACIEHIRPGWLENEFRHGVIAFGGGVLLAATSLVLVPEGLQYLSVLPAALSFAVGGLAFAYLDRLIAKRGGAASQLVAMLLDFVPEALALGAALAMGQPAGLLLALLIALQNLPEGFNAYREMTVQGGHGQKTVLASFWLMVLIGPLCAYLGFEYLSESPEILGSIMLMAASGIIYVIFKDIATQADLEADWLPQLGAVFGFLVGLIGHMLIL